VQRAGGGGAPAGGSCPWRSCRGGGLQPACRRRGRAACRGAREARSHEAEMCERKESTGEGEARTIQSNRERFKEKRARQKRERERKKNTGETETGRMDLGHGQNGKIRCPVKEK